jgi:hypothetical protein
MAIVETQGTPHAIASIKTIPKPSNLDENANSDDSKIYPQYFYWLVELTEVSIFNALVCAFNSQMFQKCYEIESCHEGCFS